MQYCQRTPSCIAYKATSIAGNCSPLYFVCRVEADEEVSHSSQPADYAFTTASPSSSAAQQLSDEAANKLESADSAKAEVLPEVHATQQSTLQSDAIQSADNCDGNREADVSPKPEPEWDATQQLTGPLEADPLAEDSNGGLTADDGAKPRPELVIEQQSTQPAHATAVAEITSNSLEAGDSSKSESGMDATQQSTQLVDDVKIYLSPRQGATSSPVSPSLKDCVPASESPLPKDAILGPISPSPKDGVLGGVHSPFPKWDASQQKASNEQRLLTPPRRERLQGNWSTVCNPDCDAYAAVTRAHLPVLCKSDFVAYTVVTQAHLPVLPHHN